MGLIQIDADTLVALFFMSLGFIALIVIGFIAFIMAVIDAVIKTTEQKRKRRQEIISNMCPKCLRMYLLTKNKRLSDDN